MAFEVSVSAKTELFVKTIATALLQPVIGAYPYKTSYVLCSQAALGRVSCCFSKLLVINSQKKEEIVLKKKRDKSASFSIVCDTAST